MEENKLIADFMEFRKVSCIRHENGKYFDYSLPDGFDLILDEEIEIESQRGWGLVSKDTVFISDLKFHSDWSWLIQVVDKIESVEDGKYDVNILKNGTQIVDYSSGGIEICNNVGKIGYNEKIEHTYQAVIKFIKWYEQNSN